MDRMNEKERLLEVLDRKAVDRPPCVSMTQTGTIDLMEASGAYWPEALSNSMEMTKLASSAHDILGLEAIRVPFDICIEASSFGAASSSGRKDMQPCIPNGTITSIQDLMGSKEPDPRKDGRAPALIDAVNKLHTGRPDTPIICGIVAPFMLACLIRGHSEALMDLMTGPELLLDILDMTENYDHILVEEVIRAGADVVTIVDATASGNVISPEQYEVYAMPSEKKIASEIRSLGGRSVLHICGDITLDLDMMVLTGVNGISVDQTMDISVVRDRLDKGCAVIGNISPTSTLLNGSPEMVGIEVEECIRGGVDIIAPGCGLSPYTPSENIRAMVLATKKYGPGTFRCRPY